jgi:hypothetical protein
MFGKIKGFYARHSFWVWGAAVFLASFALYAFTAPHTILANDNPEFTAAAALGGIPHPSGYPLYVVATWLFAKLPFGSIPFRVNLFSALCAAASLAVGYAIIVKIVRGLDPEQRLPAFAAAALIFPFAITGLFWFQAIVAKTYALNLLLTLLAACLAVKCREEKKPRDLYWFALVAGLGVSDHPMFALTLPFLAALLWTKDLWKKRPLFVCGGLFLLGLIPYIYIPIRSAAHPLLDWAHAFSWGSFWKFVTRAQYGDLGMGGLRDKALFLAFFLSDLFGQFGLALALLPFGAVWIFKKQKLWLYVLAAIIVSNVAGIIVLRNSAFSYANAAYNEPYFLPSYFAVFIFCAIGLWFVAKRLKQYAMPAAVIACSIFFIFFLQKNLPAENMRGFRFLDDLSRETLLSLPPNAVFIIYRGDASGDTYTFAFMYQKYVNQLRPDVAIIGFPSTFPQVDNAAVLTAMGEKDILTRRGALYQYAAKTYPGRPIYATFPYFICYKAGSSCVASSVDLIAYGPPGTPTAKFATLVSENDRRVLEQDVFGRQFLSSYYYAAAAYKLQNGDDAGAKTSFDAAASDAETSNDQQYADFMQFKAVSESKRAF